MPHTLHTRSLAAHVIDLDAALLHTWSGKPREALPLLQGDPIAQIMSFMSHREERRGLSAVSPQMRLDSEAIADEGRSLCVGPRARMGTFFFQSTCAVNNRVICFRFNTDSKEFNRQQMMLSLWWASRCGLPVELSIDSNDSDVLKHLGDALRSRVKRLSAKIRNPPESAADDTGISNGSPTATVLTSMLSFPNLQSLSISNDEQQADTPVSAAVVNALEAAASLPLTALSVEGCGALHDLRTLAGSRLLRSLTVTNSGLRSLEGLGNCTMLEELTIANCPQLTSLTNLVGLSRLQTVFITNCDLRSLDGLGSCVALKSVDVSGNRNLQSLSPLAGAPLLETINAWRSGIRSVQGLGSCAALTQIALGSNQNLQSLADLSKAPCLQSLEAVGCDLRDLGESGTWSALQNIDVSYNRILQSLSGLAGAPLLQVIYANDCDIRSVQGLGSCAALTQIFLKTNQNLQSLGDLSKAPCLQIVLASECDLRDIGETGPWSALQKINVVVNRNLQSLAGLAGAPLLEEVRAEDCDIQDFTLLETCPRLSKLFKTEDDYSDG